MIQNWKNNVPIPVELMHYARSLASRQVNLSEKLKAVMEIQL